jgi:hypothetical protein
MNALLEDWPVLLSLFPPNWDELGRQTGAVTRLREFDTREQVLRTLLLHVGRGWSLRETAAFAKTAGLAEVSDVTLLYRLRRAEPWLRALCQQLWLDNGVPLEPALAGRAVRVIDATIVKEPGKTGGQWRIHYSLRLPSLECDYFELTPARGKQTGERLGRFRFQAHELVLADAGYSHPPGIAAVVAQKADVCIRVNPTSLPLVDEQGRPFPFLARVQTITQPCHLRSWRVAVVSGKQRIAGRLCVVRKTEAAIERAQRRLTRLQQQGKTQASEETRTYACYVMVFTTLPAAEASTRQVLEGYRLRWQIELTFKRLKSLLQLGHIPKHNDASSRAWLYGKLCVALLSEKLARVGNAFSPWGYILPVEVADPQPVA